MEQIKFAAYMDYHGGLIIEKFTIKETKKTYKTSARCQSLNWGCTFLKSEPVPWADTPEGAKDKLVEQLRQKAEDAQKTAALHFKKLELMNRALVSGAKIVDRDTERGFI